jgi:hypothetical protein
LSTDTVTYVVVLKSLKHTEQVITLSEPSSLKIAEAVRKSWRRILGGKSWTVDRLPGVDTLDFLALTTERCSTHRNKTGGTSTTATVTAITLTPH